MRFLLMACAVMLTIQSGCGRILTDEEVFQNTKQELHNRLAQQNRLEKLMALQVRALSFLRESPDVKEVSLVLEDSMLQEEHHDQSGRITYQGQRDIIDFWIVITFQPGRKVQNIDVENAARTAMRKCGLEIECFWKSGKFGSQWGLSGWAVEPPKNPTAATLKKCPEGHTRLRDVPIVYGYIIPDDEFLKKEANNEVIRGGCVVGTTKAVVLCLECGFRYDTALKYWQLTSDKPSKFVQPLSSLLVDVPFPPDAQPTYEQKIRAGRVGIEVVWFHSAQSPASLAAMLKTYLESHDLKVDEKFREFGSDKEQSFYLTSDMCGKKIRIAIHEHKITKSNSVHFEIGDDNFELAAFIESMLMKEDESN